MPDGLRKNLVRVYLTSPDLN
eukprot:COSAG06_NODE_6574_length_2873_cov_16.945205_1_plen_20_part_10